MPPILISLIELSRRSVRQYRVSGQTISRLFGSASIARPALSRNMPQLYIHWVPHTRTDAQQFNRKTYAPEMSRGSTALPHRMRSLRQRAPSNSWDRQAPNLGPEHAPGAGQGSPVLPVPQDGAVGVIPQSQAVSRSSPFAVIHHSSHFLSPHGPAAELAKGSKFSAL
jgi:hypothetical protein